MPKKMLSDIFNLKKDAPIVKDISDYEVFSDKLLLDNIRKKVIKKLIDSGIKDKDKLITYMNNEIDKALEGYDLTNLERNHVFHLIENEVNGYGPITELLEDENITEIMVNGPQDIYVEVDGKLIKENSISFINDEHILRTIERIVQPLGRNIDAANPMVDARLDDGSRVNAIIPPLSVKGPVLTIRKFKEDMLNIDDLLRTGTLTPYMARFLEAAVRAKLNIIISGGSGTGKTTLLNVLSSFIDDGERIITIEDAAELKLGQPHVVSLETRNNNIEGEGEVTVRDLLRNALRMRPDRIIVGEVRGKEALDMLQAMNTGHEGSLTTLHANSAYDSLSRLETMLLLSSNNLPLNAIRQYIADAIDIIVHLDRLSDGKRRITNISEVIGLEDNVIKLKEIFTFNQTGVTETNSVIGEFTLNDYIPKVYNKIKIRGINTISDIFVEKGD
jgi:pilus assembly protein CpaF